MEFLLFVNPIKKRDYLLGRFLGSFATLLFVFTGLYWDCPGNLCLGAIQTKEFNAFNFWPIQNPFIIVVVLLMLFFVSALFFVSGALSRKLMVVYTQGVFIFVPFLLTKSIKMIFISP
jgi:hypothetical protein